MNPIVRLIALLPFSLLSLRLFRLGPLLSLPIALTVTPTVLAQFGEDIDLDNDGIWDLNSGQGSGSGPWRLNERDIDLDNDGIWDLNQRRDRDLDNDGIWDLNIGDNDWWGRDGEKQRLHPRLPGQGPKAEKAEEADSPSDSIPDQL